MIDGSQEGRREFTTERVAFLSHLNQNKSFESE